MSVRRLAALLAIAGLSACGFLAAASPAGAAAACAAPPTVTDPSVPWAQQVLAPEQAWSLSRGAGVLVAVVDSGVDGATPQLAGKVERGSDMLANGGAGDTDCLGHGTFVAGIIAARPASGAGFVGMAPDARILPIRAADEEQGDPAVFAAGIRRAVDAGAKIINVSASTTDARPELVDAAAYAESHDVLVVASVAKDATSTNPVYPAALPTVLAVAAIDSAGVRANFSRTGPYIGLAAPGVDVTSIGPGGPGHMIGSGTSFAAPFVSGVAALVRAYRPGLTAAQVRHRLQVTADHAPAVPDPGLGWGVVSPLAALATVLPEEGPGATVVRAEPQPAGGVDLGLGGRTGRLVVLLGTGAMLIVAGVAGLLAVLGPAGQRRRWRPARVLRATAKRRQDPSPR